MDSALYLISTPIGNLSDLSDRARQTLAEVDIVYAEDTRRTGRLLASVGSARPVRSLHEHNEAARSTEIVRRLENNESCALVSDAGTPTISDPGARVVAAVQAAGFRIVSVPGPSAVLAALAVSGLPTAGFAFLGFPPKTGSARAEWLERATTLPLTVVAFESPRRLGKLLRDLADSGIGERRAAVCRELTKLHEEVVRDTISRLRDVYSESEPRGEITLVFEGASPVAAWEGRRDEIDRAAAQMRERGMRARDIRARLMEEYGMPRNAAYQVALRYGRGES